MAGELQVGPHTLDSLAAAEAVFDFTDPLGTGLQTANTARRWCWDSDDTTSTNVGPTSGAGGSPDGYVYTEASSPGAANDVFLMQLTATIDAATYNNIRVRWKTNQRGDSNDTTCQLQTNENGAGWVNRGSLFGGASDPDKVATSGTQIWSQREVNISSLGVNNANTAVRLVLTFPATGTIWNNDYGIDEFEIIGDLAFTLEQEGFRFRNDDGSESAATWKQNQDVNESLPKETRFRLRLLINGTNDPPSQQYALQYKESGDAVSEWRNVPLT